ncbi:hypothetical protein [Deinococcus misasensis]|uniref:hypothetical protein n=1 Tax=Deinococcus misasensis TaxID=392413 RepID=UPI0005563F28|nr:hypothetical protein [Deinococcus misasensis]
MALHFSVVEVECRLQYMQAKRHQQHPTPEDKIQALDELVEELLALVDAMCSTVTETRSELLEHDITVFF